MTVINDDNRKTGTTATEKHADVPRRRSLWRFLPLAVVVLGLAGGYAAGLQHYLSLDMLVARRVDLMAFVHNNGMTAKLAFLVIYAVAVAFSFPAASILTIVGGFMFGWVVGGALTAIAATIGATALFLAARTAFGDVLKRRAGPALRKLAGGFENDAFNYLLVLRLAPIFPFFVINIAPAFFRVSLRDYVAATFIGILPGTFAYAYLGEGVDSVVMAASRAGQSVSLSDLVTPQITIAFLLLAAIAAVPSIVKAVRRK